MTCCLGDGLKLNTTRPGQVVYGTAGTTDAQILDYQTVAEATMNIFVNMLSWCNVVHDVGIMYHCSILSPELVVLSTGISTAAFVGKQIGGNI